MSAKLFVEEVFSLISYIIDKLLHSFSGVLNSSFDSSFVTVFIFCFSGFALFGFAVLYYVFGFFRGD